VEKYLEKLFLLLKLAKVLDNILKMEFNIINKNISGLKSSRWILLLDILIEDKNLFL